ncbi:peptidoglycan-binding domain-containing protein [Alteromonas aestuariivivens]|nr:peptidoglycan-binding domain-containing protein [Alteromonas aestuariivivens]
MEVTDLGKQPSGFDQLTAFDELVAQLEPQQKVVVIPENQDRFEALAHDRALFTNLWDRLYRLGYLRRSAPSAGTGKPGIKRRQQARRKNSRELKQALKVFQSEADIHNDGWLGMQTWNALQQLYTFEEPTHLAEWLVPRRTAALNRSIELRLRVFGVVSDERNSVRTHGRNRKSGVMVWQAFLSALVRMPATGQNAVALTYLYDLDKLTPLLSAQFDMLTSPDFIRAHPFVEDLLYNLLTIELWLYGFSGVKPGAHQSRLPLDDPRHNALAKAVAELCESEQLGSDSGQSNLQIIRRCLAYFALNEINGEERDSGAEAVVQAIEDMSADRQHAHMLSTEIKRESWGSWLFDGLKRSFRWLIRQLKKGVDWIQEKIRSLATAVKKMSVHVLSFYRRMVRVLSDGLSVFTQRVFSGSTLDVAICRDCDFDFKVFVSSSAGTQEVSAFLLRFNTLWRRVHQLLDLCLLLINIIQYAVLLASANVVGLPYIIARFYKFTRSPRYQFITEAFVE